MVIVAKVTRAAVSVKSSVFASQCTFGKDTFCSLISHDSVHPLKVEKSRLENLCFSVPRYESAGLLKGFWPTLIHILILHVRCNTRPIACVRCVVELSNRRVNCEALSSSMYMNRLLYNVNPN